MCYQKAEKMTANEAHEIGPELLADYLKRQKLELNQSPRHRSSPQQLPFLSPSKELNGVAGKEKCLIVDCRSFIDYNNSHVKSAINAFYSKIMRRRLLDNKACSDFILNHLSHGLGDSVESDNVDLILYAGDDSTRLINHRNQLNSGSKEKSDGKCSCGLATPALDSTEIENIEEPLAAPKCDQNEEESSSSGSCSSLSSSTSIAISQSSSSSSNVIQMQPSCWCRRSLTSSSSERFIRFLFDKLKHSTKLKFRKILLLKGWL